MNFGPRTNPCEGGGSVKPSAWVTPQGMQLGFFFSFSLFITRMRPMEIMARIYTVRFLSAVRAVAARCKHPFALRPGK